MKIKYAIIFILFVIVLGAGIGLKMFFKPHADVNKLDAEFKMEASRLMDEFQKEENTATTKYSEKVLEINGKLVAKVIVRTVEKDRCIANIMPGWKLGDVFEGDEVIPAHPPS